jgi:hypothetical protein
MIVATATRAKTLEIQVEATPLAPTPELNTMRLLREAYARAIETQTGPMWTMLNNLSSMAKTGVLVRVNAANIKVAQLVVAAVEALTELGDTAAPTPATAGATVRMADHAAKTYGNVPVANGKRIEGFPQWFVVEEPAPEDGSALASTTLIYGSVRLPNKFTGSDATAKAEAWVKAHGRSISIHREITPKGEAPGQWVFKMADAARAALPPM